MGEGCLEDMRVRRAQSEFDVDDETIDDSLSWEA
jgi:hypothetical protein